MYRIVLLDLDDTLLDFGEAERAALTRAYREAGIPLSQQQMDRYRVINEGLWQSFERGEISCEALLVERHARLFREFGIDRDPRAVEVAYRRWLGVGHWFVDGAEELLDYLRSLGCRLFLVSNGVADTQNSRLESAGIRPYFEDVFLSETVGFHKPEKGFFDHCFARIPGFSPAQTLLVGDSLSSDIRGGKNAGVATCWLNRFGKTAPPELRPDYEIQSLLQLREIVVPISEKS